MTQKQLDRFLEEFNKLDKSYNRYYDKYMSETDEQKKKMYDRKRALKEMLK